MQRIIGKQKRRGTTMLALFATFLGVRAADAAPVVLDIKREVQLDDQSCWAAVSVMALRAFKASGVEQLSQRELIFYRTARIEFPRDLDDERKKVALGNARRDCDTNLALCSSLGVPWLYSLFSEDLPSGKALAPGHFKKEIKERKRPVIIEWDYSDTDHSAGDTPETEHFLIVIGYDDTNPDEPMLRVWNPWPTAEREAAILAAGGGPVERESWIPYSTYVNPDSGNGLKAMHEGDRYKLRTKRLALLLGSYPRLVKLGPPAAPPVNARLERGGAALAGPLGHTVR
jgi:hypothetical protein